MRKQFLVAVALLYPMVADARSPYDTDDSGTHGWLGVGFGSGSITSTAPAPSAGRTALGGSIDGGYRFSPEWGLGLEFGVVGPPSGCTGHDCTPASADFAPNFTRWFLTGEYRPGDGGMRLRAGAGVSSMCYRHYKGFDFWDALAALLNDDYYDSGAPSWKCKSLSSLGASVSIGYQWSLPGAQKTLGLQLRGETANFAASIRAGTPSFRYRAVLMQVQLNFVDGHY